MKKIYNKPALQVVKLRASGIVCTSEYDEPRVQSNVFNEEIIGGSGVIRAREKRVWDEEW